MLFGRALACLLILLTLTSGAQTRTEMANRYGLPRSEVFILPTNVKLTATYDDSSSVCAVRIETPAHSERATPSPTDRGFWIDDRQVTHLISELVPDNVRRGPVQREAQDLEVGVQMIVESDDAVQITRIQRSRPMLAIPEAPPLADRLVKILWKRPECQPAAQTR